MADEGELVADDEVALWVDEGRFLVAGEPAAVDRFVRDLGPSRQLRFGSAGTVADSAAALTTAAGMAAQRGAHYVEVSAEHWRKLQAQGVTSGGWVSPMLRGAQGKIIEQVPLRPVAGLRAASVAAPQTAIAMAALRLAIQEVQEAVEAVARDVADLRRVAETVEIGNLAGLYRVLANARAQADETGSISQSTWDAIAPHEVTAQQAADRLRALLRRTIEDLPFDADADDRLKAARRLLEESTVSRTLRLLVLAEQCRLLWRSLKLEQVRRIEPEALPAEAQAAQALLAENAEADQQLIAALREAAARLGRVGPLDGVRLLSRGKLPKAAASLRDQVNEFSSARAQQLDSWAPDRTPTVRDAAREVGAMAGRALEDGRRAVGGWVVGFGTRLQGAQEDEGPETVVRRPGIGLAEEEDQRAPRS